MYCPWIWAGLWRERQVGRTFVSCTHATSSVDLFSVQTLKDLSGHANCELEGRRSIQIRRNWMGKGHAVARVFLPASFHAHRIKVDEKAGICITTHRHGGLTVTHLFSGTVLWHLPMVRECFFNVYVGTPLGAQLGACSRTSTKTPAVNTTMGISYLTAKMAI